MQVNFLSIVFILLVFITGIYSHWRTVTNYRKSTRRMMEFIKYLFSGNRKTQGVKWFAVILAVFTTASSGIGAWADPVLVFKYAYVAIMTNAPFDAQQALNALVMLGSFHTAGYVIDSKTEGRKPNEPGN
jgi:hypothetical protein